MSSPIFQNPLFVSKNDFLNLLKYPRIEVHCSQNREYLSIKTVWPSITVVRTYLKIKQHMNVFTEAELLFFFSIYLLYSVIITYYNWECNLIDESFRIRDVHNSRSCILSSRWFELILLLLTKPLLKQFKPSCF